MSATVISHFYNEEYLLPWWLKHHRQIFDHGVLIDYGSTDRSVEICRSLVPDWEVRRSRNPDFSAVDCDLEVMDIERGLSGWKMALNTTEFFCCSDISLFLWALEAAGAAGAYVLGAVMADRNLAEEVALDPDVPLIAQRYDGYLEEEAAQPTIRLERSRVVHRRPDGAYSVGRHASHRRRLVRHPPGAAVLWFGYSPWTAEMRARKLQIQTRIPIQDKATGAQQKPVFGTQHLVSEEQLRVKWAAAAARARDLRADPEIGRLLVVTQALQQGESPRPVARDSGIALQRAHASARLRSRRWLPAGLRRGLAFAHLAGAQQAAAQRQFGVARRKALLALAVGDRSIRVAAAAIVVAPRRGANRRGGDQVG